MSHEQFLDNSKLQTIIETESDSASKINLPLIKKRGRPPAKKDVKDSAVIKNEDEGKEIDGKGPVFNDQLLILQNIFQEFIKTFRVVYINLGGNKTYPIAAMDINNFKSFCEKNGLPFDDSFKK